MIDPDTPICERCHLRQDRRMTTCADCGWQIGSPFVAAIHEAADLPQEGETIGFIHDDPPAALA